MDEPTATPAPTSDLHTDGPAPSADARTSVATPAAISKRPSRRARIAGLAVAAAVLLTAGGGLGAWGATQLNAGGDSATAALGGTSSGTAAGDGATGSGFGGGLGGPGGFGRGFGSGGNGSGTSSDTTATGPAATAAQKVGVVTISTTLGYEDGTAAGTGIVLTADGEILTNNHVVAGATAIKVTVESTNTTYTASVVGTDAADDVAVLQLSGASGLQPAALASTAAGAGDAVTAIGNAGGTGSLTTATGTITDTDQTITTEAEGAAASETLEGLLETDADIIAGDSGGPLVNSDGAVVGIDTAASSGGQVQGYAIPIATATSIAAKIEAGSASSTITLGYPAFLGIEVEASSGTTAGAVVGGVLDGTPAASAGLSTGDVITKVDGHTITGGDDLTSTLKSYRPGATVSLSWTDSTGATHSAQVTLIQGPAN